MNFDDTEEEAAFRAEARRWLESNAKLRHEGTGRVGLPTDEASQRSHVDSCRRWQRTLYEGGWAGITWPEAFGGRGGSPVEQMIFSQEEARFEVSAGALSVGLAMVGPTLMTWGTPVQQEDHLASTLRGDALWCQLFSEPSAGSDLPSLITRAERDGDEYVVNGQKVWTSFAQFADWGILLARTGGVGSGRGGISYFLVDMTTPGIDVRPLRQATGVAHFNEVFLSDVRVPASHMVGAEDEGWKVARTTLASERMSIGGARGTTFADVRSLVEGLGRHLDALERQQVARTYISFELLRYLGLRVQTSVSQGKSPGAEGSILKLAISQQYALLGDLGMALLGPAGAASGGTSPDAGFWRERFVGQWSSRIGGGTDQMQRNQIGERVLGLPREPKSI
ncbi:MAG TPA: acyl-CoA dehydrogenase family protein [Acidimicrobiales bacterium]|jgi:alkylation response protein AidB-like acyl-CoA dehydrogenase|nr:acyl-CoA dehydrogenase family protein [Acidimicrobiales bacterium]